MVRDAKNGTSSCKLDRGFNKLSCSLQKTWFKAVRRPTNLVRHIPRIARMAIRQQERYRDRHLRNNVCIVDQAITWRLDPYVKNVITNSWRPKCVARRNSIAAKYRGSNLCQRAPERMSRDIDWNIIVACCLQLSHFFSNSFFPAG